MKSIVNNRRAVNLKYNPFKYIPYILVYIARFLITFLSEKYKGIFDEVKNYVFLMTNFTMHKYLSLQSLKQVQNKYKNHTIQEVLLYTRIKVNTKVFVTDYETGGLRNFKRIIEKVKRKYTQSLIFSLNYC